MLFIRAAWDIFAGAAAAFCGSGFAFASKLATVGLGFSDAIGLATGQALVLQLGVLADVLSPVGLKYSLQFWLLVPEPAPPWASMPPLQDSPTPHCTCAQLPQRPPSLPVRPYPP